MTDIISVFEVVEVTNEDVYYTLGYFTTLDDALLALGTVKNPKEITDNEIEYYANFEIREHKITIWGNDYDNTDEDEWLTTAKVKL